MSATVRPLRRAEAPRPSTGRLRVLVVGLGAVGRVVAWHLRRGGAEVAALVRPRRVDEARRPAPLLRAGSGGGLLADLDGLAVHHQLATVAAERWDAVLVCVAAPALRDPGWLRELAAVTGDAALVVISPGLDGAALVAEAGGAERVVAGMVGFLAWTAEGRPSEPTATAFWLPPGQRTLLSGSHAAIDPLLAALAAGGLPCRRDADAGAAAALGAAILDTHMAAFELAGFRLDRLAADPALADLAARAAREAAAVTAGAAGRRPPAWIRLLGRRGVAALCAVAPRAVAALAGDARLPAARFDLATFLAAHYGKVGDQTRLLLADLEAAGARLGVATPALAELSARLAAPAAPRAPADAVLADATAARLARRAPLGLDPSRPSAVKRNVHELEVNADARALVDALAHLLADPSRRFGRIRLRRPAAQVGRPFAAGDRFHGCFSLDTLLPRWAGSRRLRARIEDALLSDYAELTTLELTPPPGAPERYVVRYRYLAGTPIAGSSELRVEPLGPGRCRVTQIFEFQELGLVATFVLHRAAIAWHDVAFLSQVEQAAALLGARVVARTLPPRA